MLLIAGCTQPEPATPETTASEMERDLPPGFTDEAPPGPTSDTTVLSGGILYAGGAFPDAAIVVTRGKLIAWGSRGEVDMPNDSIGFDMRGKWIAPGVQNEDGSLTLTALPEPGDAAAFLIFTDQPTEQPDSDGLIGWFANGELVLEESSD